MRTNLLIFAFILVLGTIEAYPSKGQRFARQAEEDEDSTEKVMVDFMAQIANMKEVDNMDDIVNNEVENPVIVKEEDMPENTEIEVKIAVNSEKEGEMMKDDVPAVEDENEVEVETPIEKASTTTTESITTTKATTTIAPLGVTLRTAATTRRARPVTVRSPTTTTTRRTTTQTPAPEPGILGRLGNLINNGVGNVFSGASLGSNIISTGSLLAAAASPLWAPLLVGKKRRKRSEDISLNEIQQTYNTKLIQSHIKKAKDYYQ